MLRGASIEDLRLPGEWRRCPAKGRQLSKTCWRAIRGLGSLRRLELRYRALRSLDFTGLARLRQLRRLDLASTQLSDEQIRELATLPALEWLDLSNPNEDLMNTLGRRDDLNAIGSSGVKALSGARRLKWLNLFGLRLRDEHLPWIAKIVTLKHLDICSNPALTARGIRALKALPHLESIHVPVALESATRRLLPKVKQPNADGVYQ
jgi:Leucine-rich repeat (LRR) protein